jgi:RNA polymerase sigma-70 factor (sigma-E family)
MERSRGARTRDEFDRFVAGSADQLLRTGYLLVWDIADAEDLVQETLMRVARRWPRVRMMNHQLAYARRILVNLALDGSKRRSRHRRELDPPIDQPLEDRADAASARDLGMIDARAELTSALGTLPPRQRAVLVLRYFEDLSEAQVAEALGCSLGTVKSTTSRGLVRLQEALGSVNGVRSAPSDALLTHTTGVTDGQPTRG